MPSTTCCQPEQKAARLILGSLWALGWTALATTPADYAVRLSATTQTNPALIRLAWPADPAATVCRVYRKARDAAAWGPAITLTPSATNYVDANVVLGGAYEYKVFRFTSRYDSYGYLYAGIEAPLVETRGKVILLVDATFTQSLSNELAVLVQDLAGDGWTVLRHDVARMSVDPANVEPGAGPARSNEVAQIKALIRADYSADPLGVKALFLLGHVPVPYAGDLYPDDHSDHRGAWPADAYYGDLLGAWTDTAVTSTDASDPRNRNVPGDGKFDQTLIVSNLVLQIGRVDFANLPAFAADETALLRRYLAKDHAYRHQQVTTARQGLITDNFGLSTGEAFAANGWRDCAAFFGPGNTVAGPWLSTTNPPGYLWGYGCGAGTYTRCDGVASSADLAANDPQIVFAMLFGSYFGDWDATDNLLRATLATTRYTLASAWVGRPFWYFHHMGVGETIGFSTRLSQNETGTLYDGSGFHRFTDIALMGDPTLRLHVVGPPRDVTVTPAGATGVRLAWQPPAADTVVGYHVYHAATAAGPYTRLNNLWIAGTNYTDAGPLTGVYLVRAVKLEVSGSGSYYNASQGICAAYLPPPQPVLTILPQPGAADTLLIRGYGAPGQTYRLERASWLEDNRWENVGAVQTDSSGVLERVATNRLGQEYYRLTSP